MTSLPLLPGEVVLFQVRRHPLWLLLPLLLIGVASLLALGRFCPHWQALGLGGGCPAAVALTGALAALPLILEWRTTRFLLTSHRLVRLQAPLWLRTRELHLTGIHALTLRQPVLGRLLGYGDVVVDSVAAPGGRFLVDWVPQPAALRDRINEAVWAASEE